MPRKAAPQQTDDRTDNSKSARTRQRILDAAAHVLSRNGYAGTRLIDVAEVAELRAPAIYYYFPSREDLIEEVMRFGIANMVLHLQSVLDELPAEETPMGRIDAAVSAHLKYELEVSDYATASIRNAGQVPDSIRTRYNIEASKYGDIWRKLLRDAKKSGELRSDLDLRAARMLILGALSWSAEWWHPRRGTLEAVIRTAQSMVRTGLSSPDSPEGATSSSRGAVDARTGGTTRKSRNGTQKKTAARSRT